MYDTVNDHFNFHSLFKSLCVRSYIQIKVNVTIYHLSPATVWGEQLLRMIPEVCLYTNVQLKNVKLQLQLFQTFDRF